MVSPLRDFSAALEMAATFDETALAQPFTYRDKKMDVRYALFRTLEDAQEAHARVTAQTHPEWTSSGGRQLGREEGEAGIVPEAAYLALICEWRATLRRPTEPAAWSRSRCNSGTVPLR